MPDRDSDANVRDGIRRVDEKIPDSVNRRTFFKGAVVASLSGLFAGCTGDDGGGDGGSGGDGGDGGSDGGSGGDGGDGTTTSDVMERDIIWRTAYEPGPTYAPSYVAVNEGFWEDAGVSGMTVQDGQGSGDTARRIGTGVEMTGFGDVTPQVTGLNEGHQYKIFGTDKARTQLGLHYNAERVDDPTSLDGASIVSESALSTQSWPIYHNAIGEPDVDFQTADASGAFALFLDGQVDGIWGTINEYTEISADAEFEVSHNPLYSEAPVYGYTHIVHEPWLQEEGNQEFVTRLLEGYSEAMKWTVLNPEGAVELMRNEVPALQAQDMDSLLGNVKAGVAAVNMSDGVRENGMGYLDEEILQQSFERIGTVLEVDEIPDASEVGAWEIQDDAELATLSSSEWSQVEEFADPFPTFFDG